MSIPEKLLSDREKNQFRLEKRSEKHGTVIENQIK